jgi:hypothetical protein
MLLSDAAGEAKGFKMSTKFIKEVPNLVRGGTSYAEGKFSLIRNDAVAQETVAGSNGKFPTRCLGAADWFCVAVRSAAIERLSQLNLKCL